MRSRAVNLPLAFWASTRSAPPPSMALRPRSRICRRLCAAARAFFGASLVDEERLSMVRLIGWLYGGSGTRHAESVARANRGRIEINRWASQTFPSNFRFSMEFQGAKARWKPDILEID